MVEVDILEFFRTGSFGEVRFGMSRAQLEELLGPADAAGIMSKKERHPSIFKYGDFEFYVDSEQDRLYAIHSDYFLLPQGNDHLGLQMHGIDGRTTLSRMKEILDKAEITFTVRINHYGITELKTEGYVTLGFYPDVDGDDDISFVDDENNCLGAISRFQYDVLDRKQPTKQIAITIPESIYKIIRQEALRQRISIAKLCSQWIVESAGKHGSEQ